MLLDAIQRVRRLFNLFADLANRAHGDLAINASQRAVMETLMNRGPMSVPEIARLRPVSRQFIQTLVDQLLERNLVITQSNPGHKRSPLILLSELGRSTFKQMTEREGILLAALAKNIGSQHLLEQMTALQNFEQQVSDFSNCHSNREENNDEN